MLSGTIRMTDPIKGFGFIYADDGRQFFFHRSALVDATRFERLRPNDRVSFEPELSGPKGPRAQHVEIG